MSRARRYSEIAFGDYSIEQMSEHDLLEVVEIEELCGLSRWGWEAYRAELDRPEAVMLVARVPYFFDDKAVAGYVAARVNAGELHINNIGVRREARGFRIGSTLLETTLDVGRAKGAGTSLLEVRAANRVAQSLYRRYGYEVVGRRKSYYRYPTDDALVMSLNLRGDG
ncbi:MAG TPA: ribosomal protein S18-alanine N-acetyltransferase [Pyrinomonadaceae bacterium]|nr:ribosomal protein S18-alanine N-acetyltransferase [Pyrinomonadaceae bacterium]